MTEAEFVSYLNNHGLDLTQDQLKKLEQYQIMLKEKNEVINLTSIVEKEAVFEKHFLDSLLFSFNEDLSYKKCIDVGTGAGFPGLVLAICYPNIEMTLLEPLTKRCNFLSEVVHALDLKNVTIINQRSEDYCKEHREEYDYAFARAVSRLNVLLEIITPLIKVGGYFVALKGKIYQEEIKESTKALSKLNVIIDKVKECHLPSENDVRGNIFIKKISTTPGTFPRNYAQIKKKPL